MFLKDFFDSDASINTDITQQEILSEHVVNLSTTSS